MTGEDGYMIVAMLVGSGRDEAGKLARKAHRKLFDMCHVKYLEGTLKMMGIYWKVSSRV